MKIGVIGTGYVGLVTGVCFAEMGNDVMGMDVDTKKITLLREGRSPIYEPGLDALLASNLKMKRLKFTTSYKDVVDFADILFIAVGTPEKEDGSADLKYVLSAAESIAAEMSSYKVIVNKSTVPVGTQKKVQDAISQVLSRRGVQCEFDVVSNPEFLREGSAIEDCLKPNRVVIGTQSVKAQEAMTRLYEPFLKSGNPLLVMDPVSSEMTKYAANSMLATKISLMNEFSRLCEKVGADIEWVRRGIGSDFRIGPHFIFAGVGYGGSCFPKDVSALVKTAAEYDEDFKILKAVEATNQIQRQRFIGRILVDLETTLSSTKNAEFKAAIPGSHIKSPAVGVWGVAFKPGTDDIREAPAMDLICALIENSMAVKVYDPVASTKALEALSSKYSKEKVSELVHFVEDPYEVCESSLALVVMTEWKNFREPDFGRIKGLLSQARIYDGRNIYSPKVMQELGFHYYSIGRKIRPVSDFTSH